ncbi:carbohydrate ABC transporter permease [Kosmotoga arenicorallina]|uniref:carbohydrate ABC transporter permease n=1 Tax=Kosmotoga arenicorallina TaxID=688066 RepID=UPI000831358F|nr:sugar ABC transporter permease [Kosmotoga arenicorallina]
MPKRRSKYFRRKTLIGYLFAAPWLLGMSLFVLGPIIATLFLSFTTYDMINPPRWIGLVNYKILFSLDPSFWKALGNTFYYMFGSVFLKVFIGLFFAILLSNALRGMRIFRTIYFLPVVLPSIPVMFLWMMMFNPKSGLINQILGFFGVEGPLWLNSPVWSKPAMILMSLWGIGGIIVIFLAGLQDIPEYLYEAAELDGANRVQKFWRITVPMLMPVIFFNIVTGLIGASQVFAESYIMTGGGPLESTTFVNLKIYLLAFKDVKMGYASAMAWVMFMILVPMTILLFKIAKKWMNY